MTQATIEQIAKELLQRHWTVAVAESVTAGRVQSLLSSLAGSSQYFSGGLTTYSLEQKVRLLNVNRQHAKDVNCVSPKVCEEMAIGVANLFQVDIAVAITGYAEPNETWRITQPMAYVGVWWLADGTNAGQAFRLRHLTGHGSRGEVQALFAQQTVAHLLDVLRSS